MFDYTDGGVRAGPLGARSAGQSIQHDVVEAVKPGRNGFGDFCRNKSRTLAAASGTKAILRKTTGFRIAAARRPE
ncbi:MAG: hypothetical protein ABI132_04550 [Rhodanobacteraceae bacterium]